MPKKIALLFGKAPSGHVTAAQAVAEALKEKGAEPLLIDLSSDYYKSAGPIVANIYIAILKRAPFIWRLVYDNPIIESASAGLRRAFYRHSSKKLAKLLQAKKVDAAVCTHSVPCSLLSAQKDSHKIPLFAIVTDFSVHSFWPSEGVDAFFVHGPESRAQLNLRGVHNRNIKETGIPVRKKFSDGSINRHEVLSSIGLESRKPVILLCGGSKGLGDIEGCLKTFGSMDAVQVITLCGNNETLYAKLKPLETGRSRIFMEREDMAELMSAADIVVGKAGGITAAETLTLNKPFIIVAPLPGQEKNNTEWLCSRRAALYAASPQEAAQKAIRLINEPGFMRECRDLSSVCARPGAANDIATDILATLDGKH